MPRDLSAVVPPAIALAAARADQFPTERVRHALGIPGWKLSSPRPDAGLNLGKDLPRDDALVVILNEVLRQFASVGPVDLPQVIDAVLLLQEQVALILFIAQDRLDDAFMPDAAMLGGDAAPVQFPRDAVLPHAVTPKFKDQRHSFSLLRDHGDPAVVDLQTVDLRGRGNTLLKLLLNTPLAVFRNAAGFFLRIGSEDGEHEFALPAQGMNVLFFKENVDAERFQLAHGFQQRDRIAGEAADALGKNQVDLPCPAVDEQPLKFRAFRLGTGKRFVRIYARIAPAGMPLNQAAVMADLCGKRMQHAILFQRHAGVGRHVQNLRRLRQRRIDFAYSSIHFLPSLHLSVLSEGSAKDKAFRSEKEAGIFRQKQSQAPRNRLRRSARAVAYRWRPPCPRDNSAVPALYSPA